MHLLFSGKEEGPGPQLVEISVVPLIVGAGWYGSDLNLINWGGCVKNGNMLSLLLTAAAWEGHS